MKTAEAAAVVGELWAAAFMKAAAGMEGLFEGGFGGLEGA